MWSSTGDSDELRAALGELARFASARLAPAVAAHERPLARAELERLFSELDALGVVGGPGEPSGLALWDDAERPIATLGMLGVLGEVNAAFALSAHQRSLGHALCRGLELEAHAPLALMQGHHGLGRGAFARWLARRPLDDEDSALLSDLHAPGRPMWVTARDDFDVLLFPTWTAESDLAFSLARRADLELERIPRAHGLDELATLKLAVRTEPETRQARDALVLALRAETLGLVTIALGALRRGHRSALEYAQQRVQGNRAIVEHPAVGLLLERAASPLRSIWAELQARAREPSSPEALAGALSLAAEARPRIRDAANAALQVFGGLGYMQDVGLEKIARDVNHLGALGGPLADLRLIAAEWERGRA